LELFEIVKNNLYVGMVVKNYKMLCHLLNQEPKTSDSKKAQEKEWKRFFDWTREGQKYIIINVHNNQLPKDDKRYDGNNKNNRKEYEQFQISIEDDQKKGVYR